MLSIQQCASLACLLDVTIPKPGNVHRGADFEDMTFLDFVVSGVAIAPIMEQASQQPIGRTVLSAIEATRNVTDSNTNLGIVLLLAPLARVADDIRQLPATSDSAKHDQRVATLLESALTAMTPEDTSLVYEAIRLANPGGLNEVDEMDVRDAPPANLLDAMQHAADRDLVARQYVHQFSEVLWMRTKIIEHVETLGLIEGVIAAFLELMHLWPDSLIRRKCGDTVVNETSQRAGGANAARERGDASYHQQLADFDFWLRSDGNRRNPGTSADITTAAIFLGLVEKSLQLR